MPKDRYSTIDAIACYTVRSNHYRSVLELLLLPQRKSNINSETFRMEHIHIFQ